MSFHFLSLAHLNINLKTLVLCNIHCQKFRSKWRTRVRIESLMATKSCKEMYGISTIILLPEKFLQYDWLRADVFQLNLKYLHVKVTVTIVTPNHHIISSHELRKNGEKISWFWNQEIQELKENSENQNTKKSTSTWLNVWTKLGRKQELRKQFARLRSETTRRK